MDPSLRIVTRTPLQELWRSDGSAMSSCQRALKKEDIRELLGTGPIEFVVADPGPLPLRWISLTDCHKFWKSEVKAHLAEPYAKARLRDFPGEYFYFASQWRDPNSTLPIVLLERN